MMSPSFLKKVTLIATSFVLVSSFVFAPVSQSLTVQKAHSFDDNIVGEIGAWVQSAISAAFDAITSASIQSLATKEYVLDKIAWQLVNLTIQQMIKSTTKWVNSGFQGSPAFVTDLEGFLMNIADRVAGDFIWGSPLKFLCSPFKLNVQLALQMQYNQRRNYQAQCTLSGVVSNMESFMNGNFLAGGWDGWYEMALMPGNNPYSAYLEANTAMYASISNAQGQEIKLLEFGKGFLSREDDYGNIITPGSVIEDQLNSALGLTNQRIAAADEINELVGALFAQLVGEALGGVGGLLGLTEPGNGSSGDYFDRMRDEPMQDSTDVTGASEGANSALRTAITNEERYLGLQQQIVNLITDASTYRERVYPGATTTDDSGNEVYEVCTPGNLTSSLQSQLSSAQTAIASAQTVIATLNVWLADYSALENSSTPGATINSLLEKYNATSIPAAQSRIMERFMAFRDGNNLHSAPQLVSVELQTIPNLQTEISSFTGSIDNACQETNF